MIAALDLQEGTIRRLAARSQFLADIDLEALVAAVSEKLGQQADLSPDELSLVGMTVLSTYAAILGGANAAAMISQA